MAVYIYVVFKNKNEDTEENTIVSNLEKSESSLSLMEESSEATTTTVADKEYCSVIKKVKKGKVSKQKPARLQLRCFKFDNPESLIVNKKLNFKE
jgi:hypothetical protein